MGDANLLRQTGSYGGPKIIRCDDHDRFAEPQTCQHEINRSPYPKYIVLIHIDAMLLCRWLYGHQSLGRSYIYRRPSPAADTITLVAKMTKRPAGYEDACGMTYFPLVLHETPDAEYFA